jgi:putative ABC transport system substrate-binding protein
MITRRALLAGTGAGVLAVPVLASVRARGQALPRVSLLTGGATSHATFLEALRDQGYREGQTVQIEMRFHRGEADRCPSLAAELVALKPTVILGSSPYGIAALKAATRTIPIVGVDLESDPVAARFVASIARPGGNITGIFLDLPELSGKLLQLLKDSVPRVERVGVIWDENIAHGQFLAVQSAAPVLGLRVHSLPVRKVDDLGLAVGRAGRERVGAVVVLSSPLVVIGRAGLSELLLRHRLPSISALDVLVESGGLFAYGPDFLGMFRQAAGFVVRILKGASTAEMPVERPAKFNLLVNLKTARALGLSVPPLTLNRADRVIE